MARREARELADMRAMKIQSRRSNPVGGNSDRQAVMIPMMDGSGATPSMGLSQFRGGAATPSMGLSQFRGGRRGSSSSSDSMCGELHGMGKLLSKTLRKHHGDEGHDEFMRGMSGGRYEDRSAALANRTPEDIADDIKKKQDREKAFEAQNPKEYARVKAIKDRYAKEKKVRDDKYAARTPEEIARDNEVINAQARKSREHLGTPEEEEAKKQRGRAESAAHAAKFKEGLVKFNKLKEKQKEAERVSNTPFGKFAKAALTGVKEVVKLGQPLIKHIPGAKELSEFGIQTAESQGYGRPIGGFGASKTGAYEGHGKKKRAQAGPNDRRRQRALIVKQVMHEQGLSLPQASKYVKDHSLF